MARIRKSLKYDQTFQEFCSSCDKRPCLAGEGRALSWWTFLRTGYQKTATSWCLRTEPLPWIALLEIFLIHCFDVSSCLTQWVLKIALPCGPELLGKAQAGRHVQSTLLLEETSKAWVYFKYLIKDRCYDQSFILPRIFIIRILSSRTCFITRILDSALFVWTAQESKHP